MIIKPSNTLAEIQEAFRAKFPYLKIEFYHSPHKAGEGSPPKEQLDSAIRIGELSGAVQQADIKIDGAIQVKTLEQHLSEQFGLNAQVFRRSGRLWLQTTKTDDWTLAMQNEHGE